MTIIEFYDKAAIENIAGALLCDPDRVILVGHNQKKMQKSILAYERVLAGKGKAVEFIPRSVTQNCLQGIIDLLTELVETYEDCVFDLTGGEDLYLVAVGTVMSRYEGRVQCHRFNFRNDKLYDCDADGNVCAVSSFDITVEDQISIYGGELVTDPGCELCTYPWQFSRDFTCDIESMWEICRKDPRLWNAHIGTLGDICETFISSEDLAVTFDRDTAKTVMKQKGVPYAFLPGIMFGLQKHGLIRDLVLQDTVSFTFKNEQVKRCLTVAGQILELAIASRLRSITDKDGLPLYNDVRVGVVIDWDRTDENDTYRTVNEIDILAMKGSIPIFISCKNGWFDVNELYKLNTVAERFGNEYARTVLVTTELSQTDERAKYLRARAKDMNVRFVENPDSITEKELEKELRSLWSNS